MYYYVVHLYVLIILFIQCTFIYVRMESQKAKNYVHYTKYLQNVEQKKR